MEKIIQIEYQGRGFSIEESAYQLFQSYEKDLKGFFSKEEDGDEIVADLQYRMAEILEQKSSGSTLYTKDIEDLMEIIGKPSDFETNEKQNEKEAPLFSEIKEKLFRDKKDKIIAGVCSGIANHFAIDPIIVRLIFVLFTIFNIVTFLSFNLGILAYIIFWIILKPAELKPNVSKKLFRNPKDKILGGVCGGIAPFFNVDTWIVRLLFISPILLGFLSNTANFSHVNIDLISSSFYSLSFMSYFLLWFIIPLAKVDTDYMLLKGEPININTIQKKTSMQQFSNNSQNGLNKFLKVIAYFVIAIIVMIMIPTAIGILIGVLFSYNIAEVVLFTDTNKILALLSLTFFIALPIVGLITWIIRSILGYKPNKSLRAVFIGLNILGWVSIMLLAVSMAKQNNSYSTSTQRFNLSAKIDTLLIRSTDTSNQYNETIFFDLDQINYLMEKTKDSNRVKSVDIDYRESTDTSISIEIEKSATGPNRGYAFEHANKAGFNYILDSNTLKLPAHVSLSNKEPYYMQNVQVTIYVPAGKTVITSKKYNRLINKSFHSSRHGIHINHHDRNVDEDYVFTNHTPAQIEKSNTEEALKEAEEKKKEVEELNKQLIEEKERELEEARKIFEREQKEQQQAIDELKNKK